jgi:hypothetical protein
LKNFSVVVPAPYFQRHLYIISIHLNTKICDTLTMLSSTHGPTATNSIHTQRAILTVEGFLQAVDCPVHTKKAWLYLKKALNELSTSPSTPTTSAQDEILKRLSAIEKKLSAPTAVLPQPSTYADHARPAPPQSVHEKPVPGRALKEVTVTVIGDP